MDDKNIARTILKLVGGANNVASLNHCFTRLRFQIIDNKHVDKQQLSQTTGVISVVESNGQLQVVLGNRVTKVYEALLPLLDALPEQVTKQKLPFFTTILNTIAAIFTPIIPAIAASGMLKGILALAVIIASSYFSTDIKQFDTYIIFNCASDAVFYFMPIILGYASAKVFKTNEFIAMIIGGVLCYPTLVNMMENKDIITFLGLPLTQAKYTSSVIPIIIAVFILSYVQRAIDKIMPQVLKIIMVPTLSLLIMLPLTLLVFGPIGIYVGDFVNWVYYFIMNISPILLGSFIGGVWCILVIFGAHRAIVPIGINDVANTGRQNLLAFAGAANFSQAGAALGVFFKTKNKNLKTVAASASITALFGITEPAIYGTNLRLKKPMIYAVICGAIGGGIMGWGGSYGNAFANQGILTIPVYAEAGTTAFICYLLGCSIAFFGSCGLTILLGFTDLPNEEEASKTVNQQEKALSQNETDIVNTPIIGQVISLSQFKDEVFASGTMGDGVAIIPTVGEVIAPANATVSALYPTLHAIGLTLENGIELLIHVGIDTVNLNGQYFSADVKANQLVTKGSRIISFDIEKITQAGYDITIAIVVLNSKHYHAIEVTDQPQVNLDDQLFKILR